MVKQTGEWKWSSYGATAGETGVPEYMEVDWILSQFGKKLHEAQERYRIYVEEGRGIKSPWENLKGQIYLGKKEFIAKHQPDRMIREIPRRQTRAHRPSLKELFDGKWEREEVIKEAYREYGYRMAEIAEHLQVHYSTVSRWLKRSENT
jgi:hypothetical protein